MIHHTNTAASVGSASATQEPRSWQNVPPKTEEQSSASASDRKERGQNIPPAPEPKEPKDDLVPKDDPA